MKPPVLELRDVSFSYGTRPVLSHFSLSVGRGELVLLTGPNGSGKTTLLKLALGLLQPASGEVLLFGVPAREFKERHLLGYVPQKSQLEPFLPATVEEVVATGRLSRKKLLRPLGKEDREAVEQALELLGIAHLRSSPVGALSGGERQRVLLARALAGRPELLLLDEPEEGLDRSAAAGLARLLGRLRAERGATLLVATHHPEPLRPAATRVVGLRCRLCPPEIARRRGIPGGLRK